MNDPIRANAIPNEYYDPEAGLEAYFGVLDGHVARGEEMELILWRLLNQLRLACEICKRQGIKHILEPKFVWGIALKMAEGDTK